MRYTAPADLKTTVFFYVALEGLGNVEVANEADALGYVDAVTLKGETPDLGRFTIDVTKGPKSNTHPTHDHPSYQDKPLDRTIVSSLTANKAELWQAKGTSYYSDISLRVGGKRQTKLKERPDVH